VVKTHKDLKEANGGPYRGSWGGIKRNAMGGGKVKGKTGKPGKWLRGLGKKLEGKGQKTKHGGSNAEE